MVGGGGRTGMEAGAGSGGFNQERAKAIMEDELGKVDYPLEVKLVVFKRG
jgi:hypothetical protein